MPAKRRAARRRAGYKGGRRVPPTPAIEQPAAAPKPATPTAPRAPSPPAPAARATLAVRYQYVTGELRRIGIMAGGMFAILVILTFILR